MKTKIFNISPGNRWQEINAAENKMLRPLLVFWISAGLAALVFLAADLFFADWQADAFLHFLCLLTPMLATACVFHKKYNCAANWIFALPVLLYYLFISWDKSGTMLLEINYLSAILLLGGILFLAIFTDSKSKLIIFFTVGGLVLIFQLLKADLFIGLKNHAGFLPWFSLIFYGTGSFFLILLKLFFMTKTKRLENGIGLIQNGINKVLQESPLPVAMLKTLRDETGNIVKLEIEKVNHAFESAFKINLYEVQNQEAGYIFNLIFKNNFDLNNLFSAKIKRHREFHASNLEKWYNIHVLHPGYNQFYLVFEDISKIKTTISQLEESKKRYKVLLEAIPDIFFVIDKEGTYEDFVIKESDLFKVEDANIIGSTIFEVGFPENMAGKIFECIQASIHNNTIETIEYALNTPNGAFLFEMRLIKLNNHSVISIARDITQRKTAEINLEKALAKAEESDRLKSVFLANLSHEIRTPMNVITNFSRILAEMELEDEEKLELTEAISQNGRQLLNMIDNTIHLSKIETNEVIPSDRFCRINELLRDIYNQFFGLISANKPVTLSIVSEVKNKEFGFETDPVLLAGILSFFVDNAIKYTLKGSVTFGFEMIQNKQIRFFVADSGIGIPDDEKNNIFKRFYRVKNQINETTSGSGLGLAIARHYIELLRGEFSFESTVGMGTKMSFTLPFKKGAGYLKVVD